MWKRTQSFCARAWRSRRARRAPRGGRPSRSGPPREDRGGTSSRARGLPRAAPARVVASAKHQAPSPGRPSSTPRAARRSQGVMVWMPADRLSPVGSALRSRRVRTMGGQLGSRRHAVRLVLCDHAHGGRRRGLGQAGVRFRVRGTPLGECGNPDLVGELEPLPLELPQPRVVLRREVGVFGELAVERTDGRVGAVQRFEERVKGRSRWASGSRESLHPCPSEAALARHSRAVARLAVAAQPDET
jgi:hypothetical protein